MKTELLLAPARLALEEGEADVAETLALACERVDQANGWLLAESPRALVFEPWRGALDERLKMELSSLIIFCPAAEVRMEKTTGESRGWLRLLRDDPQGREYLARPGSALLREKSGKKLNYSEYFQPDDYGFLTLVCGRLCGVEGK